MDREKMLSIPSMIDPPRNHLPEHELLIHILVRAILDRIAIDKPPKKSRNEIFYGHPPMSRHDANKCILFFSEDCPKDEFSFSWICQHLADDYESFMIAIKNFLKSPKVKRASAYEIRVFLYTRRRFSS